MGTGAPEEDPVVARLRELTDVMQRLRRECAWKQAQTHTSLVRYLLEETHETIEAIETGAPDDLREELGDLLLQIWFHAVVAEEAGEFTLAEVADGIIAKLRRRNPHVFGDAPAGDAASINEVWESIKAAEKQRESVTDGLPPSLPALLYADKVVDRLAREGAPVDADTGGDLGERLLALVVEARAAGADPEQALRGAVRRRLG